MTASYPDWSSSRSGPRAGPAGSSLRSRRAPASRRTSPSPGSCTRTGWSRIQPPSASGNPRTGPPGRRYQAPAGSGTSRPGPCCCSPAGCASTRSRAEGEGCRARTTRRPRRRRSGASRGARRGRGSGGSGGPSRSSAGRAAWASWRALWPWARRPESWPTGGGNSRCRARTGTGWRTGPGSDTSSHTVLGGGGGGGVRGDPVLPPQKSPSVSFGARDVLEVLV